MIRHSAAVSSIASWVLGAMVVLGALPFGGVLPRDRAALQVAAFIALALAMLASRRPSHLRFVKWPLAMIVSAALLGVLQSMPWPSALTSFLSPNIAQLWQEAAALVELDAATPSLTTLSIAPGVSRQIALHWLAVAACFTAATLQGRERAARRLVLLAVVVGGIVQIAYGADRWITRTTEIWGLDVSGEPGRLRGTFVNPDHFAFYASIGVVLCAAWMLWALRRLFDAKEDPETLLVRTSIPVVAFLILVVGLAFSGSRAALVATLGGLAAQGALVAMRHRRWQMILLAMAPVAIGAAGLALFNWKRSLGRWFETSAYDVAWNSRWQCWDATLDLWAMFPFTGSGLGTFRQAFPLVQPPNLPGTWYHAHNDLLELIATLGLVAVPMVTIAAFGTSQRLVKVHRQGRRSEDRAMALGAVGAVTTALLHSLLDFPLTVPVNAFTLAIVVGLACGTITFERHAARDSMTVFLDPEASSQPLASEH